MSTHGKISGLERTAREPGGRSDARSLLLSQMFILQWLGEGKKQRKFVRVTGHPKYAQEKRHITLRMQAVLLVLYLDCF